MGLSEPARVELADQEAVRTLCGGQSENLKIVAKRLGVSVGQRGNAILISGPGASVEFAQRVIRELYGLIVRGYRLYPEDVEQAIKTMKIAGAGNPESGENFDLASIFMDSVFVSNRKRSISPKGIAQKHYVDAIRSHDIVFGIGPAGTGKTYLAMAMAAAALAERRVKRLVLTRPAVEAGEKLGFLPGDLAEKINPYLRPLYDALNDMMDPDRVASLMEKRVIEVAPLAFMRGRTLNDAFVILDEAQNTTPEQMKMFLTRLGFGSHAVVTGDITQVDLPGGQPSGLAAVREILKDVEGLAFCYFTQADVVRHPLVQEIVQAYEKWDLKKKMEAETSVDTTRTQVNSLPKVCSGDLQNSTPGYSPEL